MLESEGNPLDICMTPAFEPWDGSRTAFSNKVCLTKHVAAIKNTFVLPII